MAGISHEQRLDFIDRQIMAAPPEVQEIYWASIETGASPIFAHMCAMRAAPQMKNSDRTFNEGARRNMEEKLKGKQMQKYLEMAKKAGINTHGKFYKGGLGRPTDPSAWVSTVDDVLEVCKRKNLNCEGAITHKAIKKDEPPPKIPMAPDIMDGYVNKILQSEPVTRERLAKGKIKKKELQERVLDKHGKKR